MANFLKKAKKKIIARHHAEWANFMCRFDWQSIMYLYLLKSSNFTKLSFEILFFIKFQSTHSFLVSKPVGKISKMSLYTLEQILVSLCPVPGIEFHLQNVRRHTFLLFVEGQQPREGTDVTILPLIKILHCPIFCCRHWTGSRTGCRRCCPRDPNYLTRWRDPR